MPVAVAMPGCLGAAVIPASPQSRSKLFFEHVFNEAPDALANPSLQRIKPIRTQQWNLALESDIICHGVISSGGANRRVLRCEFGDYATVKFPPPKRRDRQWGRISVSANGARCARTTARMGMRGTTSPMTKPGSRAYHWGEDGLACFSDDHQRLCFSLALWNERRRLQLTARH